MDNGYFIEIPVYAVDFDAWAASNDRDVAEGMEIPWRVEGYPDPKKRESAVRQEQFRLYGSWDYTQAVGWVRLVGMTEVVKGYLWKTEKQLIPRLPVKRCFTDEYKIMEYHAFDDGQTSAEIAAEVKAGLEQEAHDHYFLKRRHLDFRAFDAVAPYLDWRALVGLPALPAK